MSSDLIVQIQRRLAATDPSPKFPPASEGALQNAEASLGFKIPPLLRSLYANVANGGFGPGYGIIGVEGGHASNLGTLAETCAEIKRGAQDIGLEWKTGVLPFCEWGGNIFSCVAREGARELIVHSEECRTFIQSYTLEDFLSMWLDGVDILARDRSPGRSVEGINPFTRKKTRFFSRGGFTHRERESGEEH